MPRLRRTPAGFTLVEVLVALFVMALMSALAWQGLDGVLRARDVGRESVDRSMLLATVVAQWETDLQSLHGDAGVPTLAFDGRALRLVRKAEGGVQLVAWTLQGGQWRRWSSGPLARMGPLQQAWLRSQQLRDDEPGQLTLLGGVSDWQVYYYRGNAWTNAQSTGDLAPSADNPASAPTRTVEQLPQAVRLVLRLDDQRTLTRDIAVAPAS